MLGNTDRQEAGHAGANVMLTAEISGDARTYVALSIPDAAVELLERLNRPPPITARTPNFWIGKLIKFLEEYKDGIPDTIIQSTSPDPHYKCRKGWFTCVCLALDGIKMMAERGVFYLCPQLLIRMRDFVKMCTSADFHGRHTVAEDISMANQLLAEVMAALHDTNALAKMRADCGQQALTAVGKTENCGY